MADEGVQLPDYLEELLGELSGPFLRPKEEAKGAALEETTGAVESLKETVKPQDLDSNDPRRASLFDAFVAAGFAWSVRKKRRVGVAPGRGRGRGAVGNGFVGFEPQIVWKSDVNGGRPVSKRAEIRLKIAKADESSAPKKSRGSKGAVHRGSRPNSQGGPVMTRLESVIPDETVKTTDPSSLEITGFDLLGLDPGDLTPRRNTPSPVTPVTPVTPRSRPTTRPTTPVETKWSECPMVVRSLIPSNSLAWSIPEPGAEILEPRRNWTKESSIDLPEDDHFFRAISRGKYNRALSSSFLRQISPMLRQISPDRRQVSEGHSTFPLTEFRRLISPAAPEPGPLMGKMKSEPMTSSGIELRASELPSSSISFHPGAEVQRLQTHKDGEDAGSDAGRYAPLDEEDRDSNLPETSKSSFSKSSFGLDKTFSFEDDRNMSKELSWEALDAPPSPAGATAPPDATTDALGAEADAAPGAAPPATDATPVEGEPDPKQSVLDAGASISISSEEDLGGVYLVPPWALRDHLQLDSRGATPPSRESMDRELQEVVKALEQAPALRGRVPSVRTPDRPNSGGLVARMRHLVAASPDELTPLRPGPKMALGTSLLSMSHPSRSTTKAQLQAQSQAMVKCKMPRQAIHHLHHAPASTEPWRIGQDADPPRDEESGADSPDEPVELSFIEETFFLTDP
eukprot:s3242_g3.t1